MLVGYVWDILDKPTKPYKQFTKSTCPQKRDDVEYEEQCITQADSEINLWQDVSRVKGFRLRPQIDTNMAVMMHGFSALGSVALR